MWQPDCLLLIAKAIAELINSKPCSPSTEEVQAVLRGGYFTMYVEMGGGTIEDCREAIESQVAYRTNAIPGRGRRRSKKSKTCCVDSHKSPLVAEREASHRAAALGGPSREPPPERYPKAWLRFASSSPAAQSAPRQAIAGCAR